MKAIMIGKALKLIRLYHNLKQKDLSEKLGLSQSHLSEIESGTKPANFDLLKKYSDVFEIPISSITFFAEIEQEEVKNRDSFPVKITGKALKLLEWFDSLRGFNHEKAK